MVVHRFGSVLRLAAVAALCTACSGTPTGPSASRRTSDGPGAASPPPGAGSLADAAVESFSIIEYSEAGRWFYAPQMRIAAGPGAVTVTRVKFSLPGVDTELEVCGALLIEAGTSQDLFREVYGDYEFSIDAQGRSTGGVATAVIELRNSIERRILSVDGPIVPGDLPGTYSGTQGSWGYCY